MKDGEDNTTMKEFLKFNKDHFIGLRRKAHRRLVKAEKDINLYDSIIAYYEENE